MSDDAIVPPPLCAECGNPVTGATTRFPITDGKRHLFERMEPCGCVAIDVPLAPVHTGAIGPSEDRDALAASWHRIAAAAEWLGDDGIGRLVDDVVTVAGMVNIVGAAESERVAAIREHAERNTQL